MQGLRQNGNHSRGRQKLKGIADYRQLANDMEAQVESRLTRLGLAEGPSCHGDSFLSSSNDRVTPNSEQNRYDFASQRRSKAAVTADRKFVKTHSLSYAFQQENLYSGLRTSSHGIVPGHSSRGGAACKRKSGAEQLPRASKHQQENIAKSAGNNFFGKHLGCASASTSDALTHVLPSSTVASSARSRPHRIVDQVTESSKSDGSLPFRNNGEQETQSFAHETTRRSLSLAECLAAPGMSSSNVSGGSVPSSGKSARGLSRSFSSSSSGSRSTTSHGHFRNNIRSMATEENFNSSLEVSSSVTCRRRPPGLWRHNAMLPPRESSQLPLQSPGLSELVSTEILNLDVSEDLTPLSPSFENADHGRTSEDLAEIFLALEHLERDEHFNLEQLCMLEATLSLGGAGLQDRHNDWRLDVDGMSYEELLALEERMGDVCTGLTEEDMKHRLKASKYISAECILHGDDAKCSICQDEYTDGDELGSIGCGHFFHSGCIKQWLTRKNLCPICKATCYTI